MNNLRSKLIRLFKDESGQTTTEYILILAVVVLIALKFKSAIGDKITNAAGKIGDKIEGTIGEIDQQN